MAVSREAFHPFHLEVHNPPALLLLDHNLVLRLEDRIRPFLQQQAALADLPSPADLLRPDHHIRLILRIQ